MGTDYHTFLKRENIGIIRLMKIGIIGAGFTGLAAGFRLSQEGHKVTIFEKDKYPGGLAVGFAYPKWEWALEKHYHHLFVSDKSILKLAQDINYPIIFNRPITSTLTNKGIFQLDSPVSLLKFPGFSLLQKIRTGAALAFLKFCPYWKWLENISAQKFIEITMGNRVWRDLWEPLFVGKFGTFSSQITATWFWARIFKRSSSLGYPKGGFAPFAEAVSKNIIDNGGDIKYQLGISKITSGKNGVHIIDEKGKRYHFDKLIVTLPSPLFARLIPGASSDYIQSLSASKGLGAINLVLSLKNKLLPGSVYWLNVNKPGFPFLAVVEHTNFIDKRHYNQENVIYVGKYLPSDHKYFTYSDKKLLDEYWPYLRTINPKISRRDIRNFWVWKAPFAQPIVDKGYSQRIPDMVTPLPHVFLANIQQVYPWDRGTNYAVELGEKAAALCHTT